MINSKSLNAAITRVKAASALKTDAGDLARELLPLLNQAVDELGGETMARPSRRGTGQITYLVETTQQGEVLTEERQSGKFKAFRCPKGAYDAVAEVLSRADRPLLLDEVVGRVESALGDRPPDHQVRVALRFWMHIQPPLVLRSRARYRPTDQNSISTQAVNLWTQLGASKF